MTDGHQLQEYMLERIDSMLEHPRMWGSYESVEFQLLFAVEVYAIAGNPSIDRQQVADLVMTPYREFLRAEFPEHQGVYAVSSSIGEELNDKVFVRYMEMLRDLLIDKIDEYQRANNAGKRVEEKLKDLKTEPRRLENSPFLSPRTPESASVGG
jgi:hypothetical protein